MRWRASLAPHSSTAPVFVTQIPDIVAGDGLDTDAAALIVTGPGLGASHHQLSKDVSNPHYRRRSIEMY